jgi:hypothetical protein
VSFGQHSAHSPTSSARSNAPTTFATLDISSHRELALEWTPEGITIRYGESFSSSEQNDGKKVAISLCEAMRAQGYAVIASRVPLDIPEGARASEWPVAAPKNAVVVSIGQKPNHFWQNKQLLQKGMRPIPDMSYCTSDEAFQQSDAEFKAKREQRQNDTPPK